MFCFTLYFLSDPSSSTFNYSPTFEELKLLSQIENLEEVVNIVEEEGLKYIAGYASFKFINKYKHLGNPTEMLVNPENDWINYISRRKIISPSSDLFKVGKMMNEEFQDYHGSFMRKDPWIFKIVADRVEKK